MQRLHSQVGEPGKAMRTTKPQKKARKDTGARRGQRRAYHHGDLRRALVDEALRLAAEGGVEAVNIREAARRAGVSPGAPFRHFADRAALLAAVAAEAQRRFRAEIEIALHDAPADDPLAQFRAIGLAYLRWAMRNPMYFEVISDGRVINHEDSGALSDDNREIMALVDRALTEAVERGQLSAEDVDKVRIAGRALVYGFARMAIDGHFARWGVDGRRAEATAVAMLDFFIARVKAR
jgi:AcrR family transcriptional regulator